MTPTVTLHAQWIETLNKQKSLPILASVALFLAAKIVQWRNLQRTRKDLRDLDDFMLNDIGVTRVEAQREAGRFFWQA